MDAHAKSRRSGLGTAQWTTLDQSGVFNLARLAADVCVFDDGYLSLRPTMTNYLDLLRAYKIYEYTFLDDLTFIRTPQQFLDAAWILGNRVSAEEATEVARQRFLEAGWEGDGEIGVLWIPPFVDVGVEDTWGTYIWHVKQANNGISFLLSPVSLDFQRITEQNSYDAKEPKGHPVGMVQSDTDNLLQTLQRIDQEVAQDIAALEAVADRAAVIRITEELLSHKQGHLIAALNRYFDCCYLSFLIEAMNGNRAKLKIRKSRVQLSPPPESSEDDERSSWLTLQGVISDMWAAYKFEPHKARLDMLFKSVEFDLDRELGAFLGKHVLLRNCVQHHHGRLDWQSLQGTGAAEVRVRSSAGEIALARGDRIVFYPEELSHFSAALRRLGEEFNAHVNRRVGVRHFVG